ncbi:MAG TPA: hypothetical protein VKR61_11265 [Bryobacteraceae bacterium]|nr:hypothetical protein [Bryobacteraceae bacterium]
MVFPREWDEIRFCRYVVLGALAGTEDAAHERAVSLSRSIEPCRIITTDEVLAEYLALFAAGLELYQARPDTQYSLTDWVSMRTMRREGITEALTNDRHFEPEGFPALFRDAL